MRIIKAKVQKYRSIRDSGWFDVEDGKTIFVGPNEAGKTALLKALQQLNAPEGVDGFDALRDYPRSELNDLDSGRVKAAETTVVQAISH
ncbi:MAG: AAA family ATPase [Nannocystaceae bacterium]